MEVLKLLFNYGVCWNDVNNRMPAQELISFDSENNDEYVLINLPRLINMLQLKTGMSKANRCLKYFTCHCCR